MPALWLLLSRSGFCSTDHFRGNGPSCVFLFWSKAGKFIICNQNSEKKKNCEYCHSSQWNYQKKLKRLKDKKDWKAKKLKRLIAPEVHFTIRNRVPYNKQLTNQACSGRTGEYWPEVVAVRTKRSEVRTAAYFRIIHVALFCTRSHIWTISCPFALRQASIVTVAPKRNLCASACARLDIYSYKYE